MKNKNIAVSFIPTELTDDEKIESDIFFGQNVSKDLIKIVRLNQGNINSELLEIIHYLKVGEINFSKQKLTVIKSDYISTENKNLLLNKINLHLGLE